MIKRLLKRKHRPIPRSVELRSTAAAVRILTRRVGVMRAASVLVEVAVAQARGEPFAHLGAPSDERERLCRQQAGPAILLQRALRRRLEMDRALAVTGEIVMAGTLIFLGHTLGPLDRDELMRLSAEGRERYAHELGERFFNSTMRWDEIGPERVRFTVTHCRFPELCAEGDAPEVAPLMCAGDAVYFGEVLGTVELIRDHTIAEGARECPFELRWRGRPG